MSSESLEGSTWLSPLSTCFPAEFLTTILEKRGSMSLSNQMLTLTTLPDTVAPTFGFEWSGKACPLEETGKKKMHAMEKRMKTERCPPSAFRKSENGKKENQSSSDILPFLFSNDLFLMTIVRSKSDI